MERRQKCVCSWALSGCLRTHIIQHPDAPRRLRHGQHQFVVSEGKVDCRYVLGDHEGGVLECRNLKDVANYLSLGGIEA